MVRFNVDCVVEAKHGYLDHFVPKVAPAFLGLLHSLQDDARLLAADAAGPKSTSLPVDEFLAALLKEVPEWPDDLLETEVVTRLRSVCPAYMAIFRKIYLADGIILNAVHACKRPSKPVLTIPTETEVARALWSAVAAEFADSPQLVRSRTRARSVLDEALRCTVKQMIPIDQLAESEEEESEADVAEQEPEPVLPDADEEEKARPAPLPDVDEQEEEEAKPDEGLRQKEVGASPDAAGSPPAGPESDPESEPEPLQVRKIQIRDDEW